MTIREMHIGIELGLQELNSHLFNTLQDEEKDYYLNRTIEDFVRAFATKEENTIRNIVSYADIRKYEEMVSPFIRDIQMGFTNRWSEGYIEGFLPRENAVGEVDVIAGMLVDGATYIVSTAGDTPLVVFGYEDDGSQVDGDEFLANITEIQLDLVTLDVVRGEKYRIIHNPGAGDFTPYGALSNEPGEEFVITNTATIDYTAATDEIRLKPLIKTPAWTGVSDTVLRCIDDIGLFEFLSSESQVICGLPITSGELTLDEYYLIYTAGTTNLKNYTGLGNGNDVGTIFKSILTGTPTWAGGTRLYKVKSSPNRLIKYQDKGTFLKHSYGTVISSPVSSRINNKLRVFHDKKFYIYGLKLQYVKTPATVDLTNGIDCDLPKSVHGKIVDWTVMKIAGDTQNPVYGSKKDFEATNQQIEK
ncbi:MAG: hypothetical protein US46_C0015G0003 [Candidatus Shapirobacteria bacterium GW2011_GWF2_37_20]|nr:MAG: hypothetical protein US46_C0015G0003 [Candidatus Shapirobacteria bacterium GW2011_GWF2_37_20]